MGSDVLNFCLNEIKDFFDYIQVGTNRLVQIPTIDDEESAKSFMENYVNNVNVMESEIVKQFDQSNHYTRFRKMVSRGLTSEEKDAAFKQNIRVFQKLPRDVQFELTFIPDCDLNIVDIFEGELTYDLFKRIQKMYGYGRAYLSIINSDTYKEKHHPTGVEGMEVKYPALSDDKQEEVYKEVTEHINQYESDGLNTALGEVIKELKAPGAVNQEEGINTIDTAKIMGMATNVAGKLTEKIQTGEMTVQDLVTDTEHFIDDLVNSPMFDGHPDNTQIKGLFGSLMDKVKIMAEGHQEANDPLTQDIDKLLGLES